MAFQEIARAKLNLALKVLGRRPDGYHEIESLVAFAEIGDRVAFTPGHECRVATSGPFAGDIDGPNLLDRALTLLREHDAKLRLGTVLLEKNLPVAAGLGGGSADAAALLRAVRRANPERAGAVAWHALAARLGADVPVCLAGTPALISGIGDKVEPLGAACSLPAMAAVLVNPRLPLPTAQVYQALAAGPASVAGRASALPRPFSDLDDLVDAMRGHGNDLERPADRAPAGHRRPQGSAGRTAGLPGRRHVGQRADLLRHLCRCGGSAERCRRADKGVSALVGRCH